MFDEIIDKSKQEILDTVSELIKIPSVSNETGEKDKPFGDECKKALDYILKKGKELGFKTKNIDGYCGYLEFGEGKEMVGIIGHLDVVPAKEEDGWTTSPFVPEIRDGKLYGRGSIDDKGPVTAALYAMKAVKESKELSKRVRLIIGLNEEKDWKCIDHYKEVEEAPTIGFSPDANFPAIYAEKGILSIQLKNSLKINGFSILDVNCNNNAINVVPKYCSIRLKKDANSKFNIDDIKAKENEKIKITEEDDVIKIEATGIASHAAHPELGENAIKNLIKFLIENFEFDTKYLETLYEIGLFEIESPKFLGKEKIKDESGILTSNVAILEYSEEKLTIKINLRVPVNTQMEDIVKKYSELKKEFPDLEVSELKSQAPLYVKKDSYLVKTLVDIFNKKTGLNEEAIAIGGGTYARAFENCISYGLTMPGDLDMCHQVDEFVEVDKLILASKIYAEAIYELGK